MTLQKTKDWQRLSPGLYGLFLLLLILVALFQCRPKTGPVEPMGMFDQNELAPIEDDFSLRMKICTWAFNKKAAYTIAFDDVRSSHYLVAAPELRKRHILATFNLNTRAVSNWAPWQRLANEGHEIASHSCTHPKFPELDEGQMRQEYLNSKLDILTHLSGIDDVLSFTFPYGLSNRAARRIALEYYLSCRSSYGINDSTLRPLEFSKIKGVGVYPPFDLDALNRKVDKAIRNHQWILVYFHSVSSKETNDDMTAPLDLFRAHLDYVASLRDSLWIATQAQVASYIKERQDIVLAGQLENDRIIEVAPSMITPEPLYHVRLYFTMTLPDTWRNKKIIVEHRAAESNIFILQSPTQTLFSIRPDEKLRLYATNKH